VPSLAHRLGDGVIEGRRQFLTVGENQRASFTKAALVAPPTDPGFRSAKVVAPRA
jgi:hypothetical protein